MKQKVEVKCVDALETFCNLILKKHGSIIVSIWIIKPPEKMSEDLYLIILVNNFKAGKQKVRKLELDVLKVEKAVFNNLDVRMHSGFYNLSNYFESVMKGDEEIFNEIKYSMPVYDPTGFFGPLKKLVETGKIVGTQESLFKLIFDVKERFRDIDNIKMKILDNIYSAIVDTGQAALISAGSSFPIHKDIAKGLEKHFVKKHMLEERYVNYCNDIVGFLKAIEHKKIKTITGKQIDEMIRKGNLFVNRMKDLVEEIERKK